MTTIQSANTPNFLYPTSRQFPFDEVCETIVRELEKRNWRVPGITVKHNHYQGYSRVSEINGTDFRLWFCRIQGIGPAAGMNNIAAISTIVIPKKELGVYEDESGPSFYLYVGRNWKRDKDKFMKGVKVNSKLRKEPKTYLRYKGGCNCQNTDNAHFSAVGLLEATLSKNPKKVISNFMHTHKDIRSPFLVHDNDSGREYDPRFWEPKFFYTDKVMNEFKEYLEKVVLPQILQVPVTS